MALTASGTTTCQFDCRSLFPSPGTLQVAVDNLVPDLGHGFQQRGPQGVVGGTYVHIRTRSHEVEGGREGWALGQAALEMDPRFIDLKFGFQGFEFLLDHLDDGFGRSMVAMGKGQFHEVWTVRRADPAAKEII